MRFQRHTVPILIALLSLLVPLVALAVPAGADKRTWHLVWPAIAPQRTLALGAALVLCGFLVRHFARRGKPRLRQTAIMYLFSLLTSGLCVLFEALSWKMWAAPVHEVEALLHNLVLINLVAILFFDVFLLLTRLAMANIITDLLIGLAFFVAFLHALHQAGLNPSGLIATSAVISGVIGLSLAPTIGNILGGVALQLDHSVHEGDWIQLDPATQGRVKEIRWRHTVIETRNWDTIIVPNATLLSANITILGKRTDQPVMRRYWIYFNVDFRYPPGQVIAIVNEALQCAPIPNVAAEPRPHAICFDFAKEGRDSFAYYAVRYWLTDLSVDDPTNSLIRERLYAALQRAGIPLAVPATTVFVSQDDQMHRERKDAREQARRVQLLSSLDMFREFTSDELVTLAQRLRFAPFAKGEVMTLQGREAHWLYILASGAADVRIKVGDQPEQLVRTLQAPDFFGEMGVMTGEKRAATVIATEPSECYRLDKEAFQDILHERKELATLVSRVLARRRAELQAAREGLDAAQKNQRMAQEQVRLLSLIEGFFGLN